MFFLLRFALIRLGAHLKYPSRHLKARLGIKRTRAEDKAEPIRFFVNSLISSAIRCGAVGVLITSSLGANMKQTRVNALWRRKKSFPQQLGTWALLWNGILFICSDESRCAYWYKSGAQGREKKKKKRKCTHTHTFVFLIGFHLKERVANWFPSGHISSHRLESQVVSQPQSGGDEDATVTLTRQLGAACNFCHFTPFQSLYYNGYLYFWHHVFSY